jgi:hypothetical protein
MSLPRRFLSYQNFELAFTRLVRSGNKEYKQFYRHFFSSYNLALEHNLHDLIKEIRQGTFKPDQVTIVYQPKKSGVYAPSLFYLFATSSSITLWRISWPKTLRQFKTVTHAK